MVWVMNDIYVLDMFIHGCDGTCAAFLPRIAIFVRARFRFDCSDQGNNYLKKRDTSPREKIFEFFSLTITILTINSWFSGGDLSRYSIRSIGAEKGIVV
jgi:hypothetical protein